MAARKSRPKIAMLVDFPNWAFDLIARSISTRLKHRFRFRIEYASRRPTIRACETDLIYVFHWGFRPPESWGFKQSQIVRDLASWAWELSHHGLQFSKEEFASRYLSDCACVTTPSGGIFNALQLVQKNLIHCPNGVEHAYFSAGFGHRRPSGTLRIGWVGNPNDEHKVKGLHEILLPAATGHDFRYSNGSMTRRQLRRFYAEIDVLAIASKSESQPLPLLESMSAGCFPVCTNVGIVPEIVSDGKNGRIVERSVEAFAENFNWCRENLEYLRGMRTAQMQDAAKQDWDLFADRFGAVFDSVLQQQVATRYESPPHLMELVDRKNPMRREGSLPAGTSLLFERFRRKIVVVGMDCAAGIRRFFLGDRFQVARGDQFYRRLQRTRSLVRSVIMRFHELRAETGTLKAVIRVARSVSRKLP